MMVSTSNGFNIFYHAVIFLCLMVIYFLMGSPDSGTWEGWCSRIWYLIICKKCRRGLISCCTHVDHIFTYCFNFLYVFTVCTNVTWSRCVCQGKYIFYHSTGICRGCIFVNIHSKVKVSNQVAYYHRDLVLVNTPPPCWVYLLLRLSLYSHFPEYFFCII